MKTWNILWLLAGLTFFACEGPPGPRGADGYDGYDGIDGVNGEEGFVFEYEFNFTAPDYSVLLNLPSTFEMLDSDVMLVYLLWGVTDDNVEIWRALPQTLYFDDGILHYNYDFTKYDASIFLDGTVDLNTLAADWTDQWIARVVVVPAQFVSGRSTVDWTDYNQVKEYLELSDSKLANSGYPNRSNL